MKSEVTVLLPSYNPGRYLKEALESVYAQTYENWKLILVDDASDDDSLEKVKEYLKDSRITLLRNSTNVGQSKAQNRGLSMIDTPWTIMLDSDDWFFPYTLEVLLRESRSVKDDIGLICGNKKIIYENPKGRANREEDRIGIYKFNGKKKILIEPDQVFNDRYDFLLSNYVPYPRFYRTAALKKVGGWPTDDPYEGRYLEDMRMDIRLIEYCRFHWIDCMLYNYRKHEHNTTNKVEIMTEMIEWNVRDALKRWGDKYEPVFCRTYGWIWLERLIPKKRTKR